MPGGLIQASGGKQLDDGFRLGTAQTDGSGWIHQQHPNWILVIVALATLALEIWMITEAALLWPKVRGRVEAALPPLGAQPAVNPPPAGEGGRSC